MTCDIIHLYYIKKLLTLNQNHFVFCLTQSSNSLLFVNNNIAFQHIYMVHVKIIDDKVMTFCLIICRQYHGTTMVSVTATEKNPFSFHEYDTTVVKEEKSRSFQGHCKIATVAEMFSSTIFDLGNSKVFELYIFFCHCTTTATETEQFTSITMVVPRYYQQMIWWNRYFCFDYLDTFIKSLFYLL